MDARPQMNTSNQDASAQSYRHTGTFECMRACTCLLNTCITLDKIIDALDFIVRIEYAAHLNFLRFGFTILTFAKRVNG
jgi:hypothetical protein